MIAMMTGTSKPLAASQHLLYRTLRVLILLPQMMTGTSEPLALGNSAGFIHSIFNKAQVFVSFTTQFTCFASTKLRILTVEQCFQDARHRKRMLTYSWVYAAS
jgi:hypothetical protein